MDNVINLIEHVLVDSVTPGRFALNHPKGHDIYTWHPLECFYDHFWHEGRVRSDTNGYYFQSEEEDHKIIRLQAGMIVRLPASYFTSEDQ